MVREAPRKWDPTWQTGRVAEKIPDPDRHVDPRVPARAPRELQDAVREILTPHDQTVSAAVVAFLRALRDNPERALALLDGHWPPKKRGRPPAKPKDAPDQ